MPNPPKIVSSTLLCEQFYQLQAVKTILSNGQTYYLDVEAHDDLLNYRRQIYNELRERDPQSRETRHAHQQYSRAMFSYLLIDEDRKICGEYDITTRDFQIHLRRTIMDDGNIYYADNQLQLWTYAGSLLSQFRLASGDQFQGDNE
jgi:hypothetical protein